MHDLKQGLSRIGQPLSRLLVIPRPIEMDQSAITIQVMIDYFQSINYLMMIVPAVRNHMAMLATITAPR
jgi:hypothetical protein